MKTASSRPCSFLVSLILLAASGGIAEEEARGKDPLQSLGEYRAEFVPLEEEGQGKTVIWKGVEKVAEIPDSRPVSFSPVEDILLLVECAPDDDLQHFLLNLGDGEKKKEGRRLDYVFGGRYVKGAEWSRDGKILTLFYIEGLGDRGKEEFSVEELLKR